MQRPPYAKRALTAAALAVVLPAMNGCAAVSAMVGRFEEPQIIVRSSKVAELSRTGAKVELEVEIYNPNSYDLSVDDMHYELVVGKSVLAQGQLPSVFNLRSREAAPFALPITLAFGALMEAAETVLTLGEVPYELRATLTVSALMLKREVTVARSSVLQLNLPLGLVHLPGMDKRKTRTPNRSILLKWRDNAVQPG